MVQGNGFSYESGRLSNGSNGMDPAEVVDRLWHAADPGVDYGECLRQVDYTFTVQVYGRGRAVESNRKWLEEQLNALLGSSASQGLRLRVVQVRVKGPRQ